MRAILLPLLLWISAAGLAPAQSYLTLVSPRLCEKLDGSGQNAFPFSGSNQFSFQQLHDDLWGRPRVIHELAFRINLKTSCAARTMNLTLKLSTSPNTSATASSTFAANHGTDLKTVISKQTVKWPAQTASGQVAPFAFTLGFMNNPFIYRGVGTLCWEVRVHSNTQVSYVMHDAVSTSSAPTLAGPYGAGCTATGASAPAALTATFTPGAAAYAYDCRATNLPASKPGIWFMGTSCSFWGGLLLPFDLGPLGAKGCSLHCSIALVFPGTVGSSGALALKTSIPYSSLLAGLPVYSQCAAVDPGPAPLPLVFTNGHVNAFQVATTNPYGSCRIYGRGGDTLTSGILSPDYPLVTRFGHR